MWFEFEKNNSYIGKFLDCNWGLHDFRLESINYIAGKDMVEIFLKYDDGRQGRLLRFADVKDMSIKTDRDYMADWIYNSGIFITDCRTFIWMESTDFKKPEDCKKDFSEMRDYTTWVESSRLFWAVTDGNGTPVEMPAYLKDQVWDSYGKKEEHHQRPCGRTISPFLIQHQLTEENNRYD